MTRCKWPLIYVTGMQYWPSGAIVLYVCTRGRRENLKNVIIIVRACGNDSDGGRLNFFLSFLDHYPFITVTVTGGINP